ncbi:MAG TPA: hypothetical protein DCL54_14780, partial [Alphaproteobacteria bacterium]|nr:hypothetical protein [Alphaproteobacteria bacterium]
MANNCANPNKNLREELTMIRLGLGALVSAFAMFMWGFVFWAMGLIDPFTHLSKEGEAAILEAVRAHVPTHGLYMVPEPSNWSEAEIGQKMKDGPYAMLHVSPRGAEMGGQVMALGYLHMLVTSVLLGLLLLITLPAGATWGARFRIALLA